MTKALNRFVLLHETRAKDGLRLGQRFCNMYIKKPWPELYYVTDKAAALRIIDAWLTDNHYTLTLPKEIKR